MTKLLFLVAAVSVTLLMFASIVSAADNVTTTTGNDTQITQTTIAPSTTARDITAAPSVASSTAAPASEPTNPPPAPTTKAPMTTAGFITAAPMTTAAPDTPTTAAPSATAAPFATILITLKEASFGSTEAARTALIEKLAGMLNIEPSLLTASLDPADSMKLIVTLRPSGNASAAELAAKAEDLSASQLSALGASAIVSTTPMPSPTPESSGFPVWAIAAIAGGVLLLLVVGVLGCKGKKDDRNTDAATNGDAISNTLSRYEAEAELRTTRGYTHAV